MAAIDRAGARNNFKLLDGEQDTAQATGRATMLNASRSRRSAHSASVSDRRRIFAVAASHKGKTDLAQLAAAWPDAAWQEFAAGHDFLRAAGGLGTGCVVIFDPLPDIETLAVLSWLSNQRPDLASLVVSSQPTIKAAVDCLKAGASDYLNLPLDKTAVSMALHAAFEPGPERLTRGTALARLNLTSRLSQRELQVLDGLLVGLSNKEVGAKLHISERTVEVHRSRIMRRLGVNSFAELVRLAVRAGIGEA